MQNILLGIGYCILGQAMSFLQLQAGIKYNWYPKYLWISLLLSIPISWIYLKSVEYFIQAFNGDIFPSRILGFSIGIIIFTIMSSLLFGETLNTKNMICIILGLIIVYIQIF